MEVYDGVTTTVIWPILVQLNTNILTLFPRKYYFCCTNLESMAIPAVWATFMTSFQKDNISHVNTCLLVLNTFCIIRKRYGSSLSCGSWVLPCFSFLVPWDLYFCIPVTQEGQGCESYVQLTSSGLRQVLNLRPQHRGWGCISTKVFKQPTSLMPLCIWSPVVDPLASIK